MSARTLLFWVDFEATSLDVRKGHGELLEYAVVFTDLELNELDAFEGIIPHPMERIESLLAPKAREMHVANGLLAELTAADGMLTLAKGEGVVKGIEEMLLKRMRQFMAEEPTIFVTAGSSVWYDRNAIKEHMPKLDKALHYRLLDVSVYKVGFPEIFGSATSTAHRAMADIRESIKKHALMRNIISGRTELVNSSLQLLDNASVYDTDDDEVVEISEADFSEFERTVRRVAKG